MAYMPYNVGLESATLRGFGSMLAWMSDTMCRHDDSYVGFRFNVAPSSNTFVACLSRGRIFRMFMNRNDASLVLV